MTRDAWNDLGVADEFKKTFYDAHTVRNAQNNSSGFGDTLTATDAIHVQCVRRARRVV